MAYETKDLSGSLFQNDRKEKESHPDYTGSLKLNGKEYWLSGWKKATKDGKPWLSLSLKPKESRSEQDYRAPAKGATADDFADREIPF